MPRATFVATYPSVLIVKQTAVLLLALAATGCMTWKPQNRPIGAVLTEPTTVRVILRPDSAPLTIEQAVVRSDTLFGREQASRSRRVIPIADIQTFEIRRVDAMKTSLIFVVLCAVFGFFAFMRGGWMPNE